MVFLLCISSDDALYLYKVSRKYLKGFRFIEGLHFQYLKFSKGHNSVHNLCRVMVLVLCTSSDRALYLYKVS